MNFISVKIHYLSTIIDSSSWCLINYYYFLIRAQYVQTDVLKNSGETIAQKSVIVTMEQIVIILLAIVFASQVSKGKK